MWLRINGSGIFPSIWFASGAMLRAMASDATSFFENAQRRAAGWLAAWDGQGIPRSELQVCAGAQSWSAKQGRPSVRRQHRGAGDLSLSLETQSNLSKDHQEAVWAFAQKRRPNFTGR